MFIDIPDEDEDALEGEVGQLQLCLFGTRDAAKEWQKTLPRHLVSIGFSAGKCHTSIFHHHGPNVKLLVHGDDYFSSGHTDDLNCVADKLTTAYEIQTQRIGNGPGRELEGKILNRIVRWRPHGYEIEADLDMQNLCCSSWT